MSSYSLLCRPLWASLPTQSTTPAHGAGLFRSRGPRRDMGVGESRAGRRRRHRARDQPNRCRPSASGGGKRALTLTNGGRDWTIEAPAVVVGSRLRLGLCRGRAAGASSTAWGSLAAKPGTGWRQASAPQSATPARAIVAAAKPVASIWPADRIDFAAMIGARRVLSASGGLPPRNRDSVLVVAPLAGNPIRDR